MSETTWTTNTDLPALAAWLRGRRRVVVLTHIKPDGDAVGSTLGIARAVAIAGQNAGVEVTPWYAGPLPDWFDEIAGETPTRYLDTQGLAGAAEPDGILIVDTGSWSQLHEVRGWLEPRRDRAAVLDHHLQGDGDVAPRRVIQTHAAAAAEPSAELCRLLLGRERLEEMPVSVAEPLYLGLAADTGWFRHSNTSPSALRTAAALLDAGVNHAKLYELTEQRAKPSRLRLLGRALSSLELYKDETVAVMTVTLQDVRETHAGPGDSGGFADLALAISTVRVSAVVSEAEVHPGSEPMTKVSMRSKTAPGSPDVNEIAKLLGGGGHARAAGAKMKCSLAEGRRRVIEALT